MTLKSSGQMFGSKKFLLGHPKRSHFVWKVALGLIWISALQLANAQAACTTQEIANTIHTVRELAAGVNSGAFLASDRPMINELVATVNAGDTCKAARELAAFMKKHGKRIRQAVAKYQMDTVTNWIALQHSNLRNAVLNFSPETRIKQLKDWIKENPDDSFGKAELAQMEKTYTPIPQNEADKIFGKLSYHHGVNLAFGSLLSSAQDPNNVEENTQSRTGSKVLHFDDPEPENPGEQHHSSPFSAKVTDFVNKLHSDYAKNNIPALQDDVYKLGAVLHEIDADHKLNKDYIPKLWGRYSEANRDDAVASLTELYGLLARKTAYFSKPNSPDPDKGWAGDNQSKVALAMHNNVVELWQKAKQDPATRERIFDSINNPHSVLLTTVDHAVNALDQGRDYVRLQNPDATSGVSPGLVNGMGTGTVDQAFKMLTTSNRSELPALRGTLTDCYKRDKDTDSHRALEENLKKGSAIAITSASIIGQAVGAPVGPYAMIGFGALSAWDLADKWRDNKPIGGSDILFAGIAATGAVGGLVKLGMFAELIEDMNTMGRTSKAVSNALKIGAFAVRGVQITGLIAIPQTVMTLAEAPDQTSRTTAFLTLLDMIVNHVGKGHETLTKALGEGSCQEVKPKTAQTGTSCPQPDPFKPIHDLHEDLAKTGAVPNEGVGGHLPESGVPHEPPTQITFVPEAPDKPRPKANALNKHPDYLVALGPDNVVMGEIKVNLKPYTKMMKVTWVEVVEKFRQQGVNGKLLEAMLARHPDTKIISGDMFGTNYDKFLEGLEPADIDEITRTGKFSPKALGAIKETPFYKTSAKLGFTEFDLDQMSIDLEYKNVTLALKKP